jgi:chromosome segregation ATPase
LVEQAMFFLVGFLVAGLIALLFLPVLARRATRLSEARARLTSPLSQQQAIAERDQLRAEHAVDRRRLEQRVEELEDSVAVHRADLGRQATKIVQLEDAGAERLAENEAQRRDLAQKSQEIQSLEAELSASRAVVQDLGAQLQAARAEIAELSSRRIELDTLADKNRTIIAGLETRVSGLEIELDDSRRDWQAVSRAARLEQLRLAQSLGESQLENSRLKADVDDAMAKGALLVAEIERNSRQLHEAHTKLAETEALLARGLRAREDTLVENGRLLSAIAERDRCIAEIEARDRGAPGEDALNGDAALRQAISRLASDVVRLNQAPAAEPPTPNNLLNFEPREPGYQFETDDSASKGSTIVKLRQMPPRAPDR